MLLVDEQTVKECGPTIAVICAWIHANFNPRDKIDELGGMTKIGTKLQNDLGIGLLKEVGIAAEMKQSKGCE